MFAMLFCCDATLAACTWHFWCATNIWPNRHVVVSLSRHEKGIGFGWLLGASVPVLNGVVLRSIDFVCVCPTHVLRRNTLTMSTTLSTTILNRFYSLQEHRWILPRVIVWFESNAVSIVFAIALHWQCVDVVGVLFVAAHFLEWT
jgi:hypothetical protein